MNVLSWFSNGVDKVVDSVGNAIDKLVTSDEEKLILRNALAEIKIQAKSDARKDANEFEKEITKRWTSDNEHNITRLVRPISYITVLVLFISVVIADGNLGEFTVKEIYIPVIEGLLSVMTIAYFGSRGLEKITKSIQKGK